LVFRFEYGSGYILIKSILVQFGLGDFWFKSALGQLMFDSVILSCKQKQLRRELRVKSGSTLDQVDSSVHLSVTLFWASDQLTGLFGLDLESHVNFARYFSRFLESF